MAPVAALAPEFLPARAAAALSRVPKALSTVPKIGGALEEMAPMAGRFALTGPIEAMMEGGNTEREMLQNGATPEEARQAAWDVFGENVGLLTATNALEGGLLGKIKIKTPRFSNPVANTASRAAGYVPTTAAEMALQGYEEGAQQGIQNGVEGESPNTFGQILNPTTWTDDQWDAAKMGIAGAVPLMGAMGAVRHFGNRGGSGNSENGSNTAANSLLSQAQTDINSANAQAAQQAAAQAQQDNASQETYTTPADDTTTSFDDSQSSAPSYDASVLEGDPQYTVSDEVSSTDVTPLTDQKMRLLDAAYYNKYGQHLYITSMKRNGDGSSWHDSGQAFDTADDNLESNKEARDWLVSEGEKLGLTPLDEYENPSAHATGGHIHFSYHGDPIPGGASLGDDSAESDVDVSTFDDDTTSTGADLSNLPLGNIAMAISQNTGLPSNLIWAQLAHESANGTSQLAQDDHNYGGVKGEDGEYLHFDNDQQFIDYMSNYYPKYREDGIYDAKNADQWAEALQHGGYFTAGLDEYEGGMKRHLSEAGLSENAMQGGTVRRSRNDQDKSTGETDLSGSFDISADDPGMDNMFASFAKDWQNMSTDANEINFFGDMFSSRGKFKATEENKQAILDNYGDAFRQYVQENQPQTVQTTQAAQAPAQPKQAPQPQRIEMQTPNLDKAKTQQNVQQPTQGAQMPAAPQEAPRKTLQNVAAARLNNMLSEISGNSFKKLDHVQKLAYLMTARSYANTIGADQANNYIDSTVDKVRRAAGFTGNGVLDGMNDAQKNAFYRSYTQQAYDAALDLRRNATDDTPTNLNSLDNTIQFLQQEVAKYKPIPTSAAKTTAKIPKRSTALASIPDSAIAAAKQADDGFSAPLNIFSSDEQAALRDTGLVYKDDSYNGAERVKAEPLYEEGDRRMNGGKVKAKAKAQAASKADKYKNDAEKIYLRFKSGKFSAEDSINQLNNLKKKAMSDKTLSNEEKAEVVAEADKHINRIKPQKETKKHETQENSKTAETTQGSKAEGYSHQDAEPEKGRADAEESEVRTRKAADTQREAEEGEVKKHEPHDKYYESVISDPRWKAVENELTPVGVKLMKEGLRDSISRGKTHVNRDILHVVEKEWQDDLGHLHSIVTVAEKDCFRDKPKNFHELATKHHAIFDKVDAIMADHAQDSDNKKAADEGGHTVQELAPGYKTESGKPLSEAGEKEFILKPDGSKNFGEITAAISKAAKKQHNAKLAPGKIRLRVGNDKEGLIHAKKHEEQAKEDGYTSIEDMIADVADNFDKIYAHASTENGHTTYSLVKHGNKSTGKMNGVAPFYLNLEDGGRGNYYVIVTAIPKGDANLARQTKKDRLIYSSPGLDTAAKSNAGAVSTSARSVGAETRGGTPTSDKSSGSSTHIIPHEQKEGTKNLDSAKVPAMGEPIHGIKGAETEEATKKKDESIFGSVEDADKEMLDALGLSEEDLADDVLTAPSGIKNTAEERERLEKELSAELNKMSSMPMFNPKIYTLGLKLAMTYVKDGINTVKKLVAKLNATFGDKIGPWAPALAETVRTWPKGVPFDEKKVMAISKAVGARYENGITSLDDMQADMKKLLKSQHDSFAPMIEASYNGIRKFFEAREGENGHVDDSTSGLAERAGRGSDSDRVGPDDAGGESGRGSGRGVQKTEEAVQPEGGARVRDRSAAAGGETGNSRVQDEESGDRAGGAGSAHVSRSVRDSYEGSVGHDADRNAADVRTAQNRRDNASPAGARARAVKPNKSGKRGDLGSIKNDLPMLKPEQQEDVEFIETRVNVNNKPGVMLTNGTGTGKTYSGLGFVKRMYDAGKKNILIVSPSESINDQWIEAASKHFDLSIEKLDSTKDSGKDGGICITTYANLQANRELVNRNWDAVVSDESHTLMQNEKGEETGYLSMLRALTLNPRGAWKRFKLQHRTKEIRALESKVDAKEKEIKDILKPYKGKKKVSSADNAKVKALQKDIEDIEREMDGIFRKMAPSTDKLMQDLKASYPEEKRPKVLFLSATPFAHDKDVDYAEGYLFNYEDDAGRYGGYNQGTPSDRFMMKHFGYRMRYNKLTRPDVEVDSRAMEVQFHDDLVNSGAMHGRQIDVDKDYDRGFILVDGGIGHKIDEGFKFLSDNHAAYGELHQALLKQFNKSQQKYLIESIKAREVIPLIQEYVKKGKKVVLFHQSMVEHKNIHPFQLKPSADLAENSEVWAQWKAFKSARPDLVNLSLGNIPAPMETLRKELGGHAVFVNGKVPKDERARGIEQFNDDNSGMNIIVCQQDAANAGISLHDTTGKHPRVLINIAMPERPSYAMQIEGRIYRVGNASNAIFRYLSTGTDIEKNMFASTIGGRAASVENLAVGNAARGLRESFRDLYQETMDGSWKRRLPGAEGEGTGGKEMDYAVTADLSEYDRAKSFYFAHQKRTSRTKAQEGNDYFATPEPIGYKMVEWLGLKAGEKAMEPSAGHGAISRWFPETTDRTIVEPSAQLMPLAQMNTPGAKTVQKPFEDFNIVNKFDGIAMNPPFGMGGKTAVEHLQKAFKQLHDGGRVIAIIPEGPAADKRYNKMMDEIDSEVVPIADIHLPAVTFSRAGTNVGTHIVVLDRYTSKAEHQAATRNVLAHKDIDLRDINDINNLFNRLENMTMPERYDASSTRKAEPVPAPAVQLDEAKVEGAPDETPNFTVDEYERTDTHEIKFRARPKSYLGEQYRPIQKLAKAHGGHYSRFAKASFLFDDKDERDAFLQEAEEYLSDNKYSAEEAAEAQERALSDIKQEVASAFPNAKNVRDNGHEVLFSMPNGAELSVSIVPSIEVTESEENNARAAHGLAPEVHVKISGKERTIGSKALIELSQLGRKGTAYHEAFHAVYDMCLTDKEKAALHKAYDKEAKGRDVYEVMADKYRDWMIAKQKGQHTLYGKLWQKVKDAAARLARVVRGADNASDVFRKVASGDVWERPLNERNSDNRYLVTNEKVRPDTKVPIIDVTNEEKINVNSNKAAADIAKALQGTAFRIIASDGVGEIETLKEGKHFVHGSNNLSRFDKTRRKALSVSEKILNNCVYVEKHPDVKHGTDHRYIELFAAVKDGEKMVRFRVVAREGEVGSGEFKIGQARFYDIIKDGKLPMYDTNGRNSIMGSSPSTLTVAELLKGVKDRNGRLYVNKDGSLNYDARIFRDGEEQEKKGAQSFLNTAASKLGKRMGVKSDKIIMEESNNSNGANKFDYLFSSPSRIAGRVAAFRQFYRMGARAMEVLTERRSYYQRKLGKAMQLVKSKNDYEELTDILLSGDAEGKEWTKEELIQSGTKENVAEAYTRIRRLMRQAYKMVNEAHKHPKTYSKRLSESNIEELRQNPFVKIMKVHDEEEDGRHLVTYREFANYEHTLEGVTKQALDGMRVDEDMQVLEAAKQADGTYKVRVREGRGDVTNRKGYIPHFFHNYMVEVRDGDGNYVTTLTSGRTQREAVKKAEAWMKDNKLEDGQEIYIHPKIFDFTRLGMSERGIVQLGDKDFYALMNRVAKDNDMSFKEAKDLLQGVHQKNRHRFFGNVLHRKGVSGFETDMNYVLNHYFNSASRYYAMETEFKPQAISLYERLFGDFAKDPNDALQQYTKDYINDVNGSPSAVEKWINKHLMNSKFWRYFVVSRFGERAALQAANSITSATTYMCLGYFNVSSALLNLTQVMNSAAYIGDVSALGKCLSKGMHRKYSLHDLKVLKETNVLNDIGLDSGSGYDMNRMSAKNLLGKINKAGMSIFKVSEQTVRIGTVLAAYESGIKRGMSHEEAIDFAKEVNRKSNFDYSIADAPNIFRRGSIFSQLALQFKKYGIKELEVMADMCSPRTSRKQKLLFWGTYLLAAGLCGLPALNWLDQLLAWVLGTKSPKLAAQAAIMEAAGGTPMGKFIGRMAMYGLPSALVGVDLSTRVGLSDVVPTDLKNFLPPLATKIPQFMHDIFSDAKINAVRDFSPAIYNQIAAWGTGESYGKRGRVNTEYNTFYDKLLRSIGFKSTDERIDSDIRRITSQRRSELTQKKQDAVDAYINNPTSENKKKLKDLGIKDSTVEKERQRKKEDSYNRTRSGMTKKEAAENKQLLDFK
ncbi:DEAD/DEAH box helicase family protein [uncultured Mitsuokella sp.]|uniref:DEAD/DEAH box helicase family protein n=1 Tax=uncultured Mitsuokella sp. TaxID=453120 RepID=UPI0026DB0B57|nr:DEAD/DEAH box helicase family protein [uncultured Mitsuokella sp.]